VGGSPYYLPPDRLSKGAEGPYSEIYSLGMVMFTALTSGTFFKFTGNVQDLAMKHIQSARMTVNQGMMPQSSPATVEMIGQMIRKDPEERYQKFEEVELAAMQCLRQLSR
jgi:serine/threonine protein kinase